LTAERVDKLIETLKEKAELIKNVPAVFAYSRDPKDEKYINLAAEANADYIVSRDNDLLDLMTGHTDECKDFRRRFRPLKVVDSMEFLQII
jgi:predicted nucleic acid-binding protein